MTERPGLRERKRQETLERITAAGLKLFAAQGYEATTLDAIAAEAGISRRTFFHYFKSKDDILISMQSGLGRQLAAELARRKPDQEPLQAIREAGLRLVSAYAMDELIVIDRIMRSSETVQARKRASYVQEEAVLFVALQDYWPGESETTLRLLALLAIGAARLSLDAWSREGTRRPLGDYINETFDAIAAIAGKR